MSPKPTVADHLVQRLSAWGVELIFGFSGDGINTILGALARDTNAPRFIAVAHEEIASLSATAYAKTSGNVGVCMSTQGPGAIHLLNGVYDAKLDHTPLVAIVGQYALSGIGASMQQEADLRLLFRDACPDFCETVAKPAQLRHVVDRAFRIAATRRAPVCIIIPHDVQQQDAVLEPPHEHGKVHSSIGIPASEPVPSNDEIARAADILNAGERVAIIAGAGALDAAAELAEIAEALGAGVAKALLGKAVLPDYSPSGPSDDSSDGLAYVTGSVGWLGTEASDRMMQQCDTLLMVGTGFPYPEFLPREGAARAVQIDRDAANLGLRYPTEVNLHGESATTLQLLMPLLKRKTASQWRSQVSQWIDEWYARLERESLLAARNINPQRVAQLLSPALPDNVILTADSGTSTVWYARHLRVREGMLATLSGTLATMGCALPYGFAAKFAQPSRPVVSLTGDGGMQMLGNAALIDVARRYREWENRTFVIVVFNNRDLNYVTWEQRAMEGIPRVDDAQAVPEFNYATYAEMLGLGGIRIDETDQIEDAIRLALAADRPFVIDAIVDPAVPTLPPQLREEQQKKLQQSLGPNKTRDSDARAARKQIRERYPV